MSGKHWAILVAVVITLGVVIYGARALTPSAPQPYKAKVNFSEGTPVPFKDFTVTYLGKRQVTPKQYPRGWWIFDFKIEAGGKEQKVSWSAGTGSIDPARFEVGGRTFQLELGMADKIGQLKENEMVVSPAR